MTIYEDARGWQYKVMPGLGGVYKARYQKPGTKGWKCCRTLQWKETPEEAQIDLDNMALRKKFFVVTDSEEASV